MKLGIHYSFQSTNGDWATAYEQGLEQIRTAEKYGFDCVTVAEHHFMNDGWIPSPMVACGAIASVTSTIRIGTNIVIVPLNNPVKIAEDLAVLDNLSRGRSILGLGLGGFGDEFNQLNVPSKERKPRLEEGLAIIKELLEKPRVTYKGDYWQVIDGQLTPKPVQKPRPPLWIGALEEPAIVRAARYGDAWIPSQVLSLFVLKEKTEIYNNALKACGKEPDGIERPLRREGYVAASADRAWEDIKDALLYEYGDVYYKSGNVRDEQGNRILPGERTYEEYIEELRKIFIISDPDTFIAKLEEYEKSIGTSLVLFRFQVPGLPHEKIIQCIKLIGEKIIPYFRENDR